jgi:hypothetical protein
MEGRDHLGYLGIDGRISKWILKRGYEGVDSVQFPPGRDAIWAVVNTGMNLRVL